MVNVGVWECLGYPPTQSLDYVFFRPMYGCFPPVGVRKEPVVYSYGTIEPPSKYNY
jgi:hypothetical protein